MLMEAYDNIEYSNYQFLEESKWNPPPPGPCGSEKSVVLRGLNTYITSNISEWREETA